MASQARPPASPGEAAPVALLCAAGDMPCIVADEAVRAGWRPFLIGVEGLASRDIERFPHAWIRLGQIGRVAALLRERGIRHVGMIGALARPRLADLRLDLGALVRLPAILRILSGGGDDALLRRFIRMIEEREGLSVVGAADIAPGLVLGAGALGRIRPDGIALAEGRNGLALLRALSPFDCGQAVVMVDRRPVAIEGAEGTDAMIARVADLRANGRLRLKGRRGVLVKAPKAAQEMRADMPTIGPRTLERCAQAGLAGVVVASGGVLAAGRAQTREAAEAQGLFVYGLGEP